LDKSEALSFFRKELPKEFQEVKTTREMTDREGFWIGYHNSLAFMEGYFLKQAALLERAQSGGKEKRQEGSALKRFCKFLSKAHSLD